MGEPSVCPSRGRGASRTPEQRKNFEILGDGLGAHWPELDEDLSAEGMLSGVPARRPRKASLVS